MKKILRKKVLKQRNSLSEEIIHIYSQAIFQQIRSEMAYKNSQNIMSFMSFGSEIKMDYFNKDIIKKNGYVIIPRVNNKTNKMDLYKVDHFEDFLLSNYNIMEPDPHKYEQVEPSCLDMILCPGVVFDQEGYRIGYGGGFYDKLLSLIRPSCYTFGVGFSLQMTEHVPREFFDKQLDRLYTEEHTYIFERRL